VRTPGSKAGPLHHLLDPGVPGEAKEHARFMLSPAHVFERERIGNSRRQPARGRLWGRVIQESALSAF
jgi:hypothetical protein